MIEKSVLIGENVFRNNTTPIRYKDADRLRHMYMVGKTGSGKSSLFLQMCLQDILAFKGVCFIDPHGDAINWLLSRIPKGRLEDVVVIKPGDVNFPVGLNLLEVSAGENSSFLVSELINIFYRLFDPEKTGIIGPQFEHWLRNGALTVMADPNGGTLLEIPKLFSDKKFESYKRQFIKDPLVMEFWQSQMSKTSDFHRSEMLNYFTSKFGQFMGVETCRNIVGQTNSTINFQEIINKEKILLVDLSKGSLGELTSKFLGLVLLAKLQSAVLSRAQIGEGERIPFYLYVDEFQNFTTDTFLSMLAESRKYGLAVHVTNQYITQLPEAVRKAVLASVGTTLSFQVGAEDAEILLPEFSPFSLEDLTNLPARNFLLRLMVDGRTTEAFSGQTISHDTLLSKHLAFSEEETVPQELVLEASRLMHSTPVALVQKQILSRLGIN